MQLRSFNLANRSARSLGTHSKISNDSNVCVSARRAVPLQPWRGVRARWLSEQKSGENSAAQSTAPATETESSGQGGEQKADNAQAAVAEATTEASPVANNSTDERLPVLPDDHEFAEPAEKRTSSRFALRALQSR